MIKNDKLYSGADYQRYLRSIGANMFDDGGPISNPYADYSDTLEQQYAYLQGQSKTDGNKGKSSNFDWGSTAMGIGAAIPNTPMTIGGDYARNGIWDAADPTWYLAQGRSSKAGDALSDAGVATTKAGLQSGNGWVALAGAAMKIGGSLANAIGGTKANSENINRIKNTTNRMRTAGNMLSNANTNEDVLSSVGYLGGTSGITSSKSLYRGGWGRKSKARARRKGNALINEEQAALAYQNGAINNATNNATTALNNNVMANFSAFGGPLWSMPSENTGALDYSYMTDYLANKKLQTQNKNTVSPLFGLSGMQYAFGGNVPTHGSDFSTGLTHINEGSTHEQNPYQGVQYGVDGQGVPNLVEEGETIWNNYVFSNRIQLDKVTREKFHIGKNKKMTYAELSKRLEKEVQERVNDPISKASLKKQMTLLAENQERQKQEIEAKRIQEAFDRLSPEQKQALLQQVAMAQQQAQMSQEQAAQQQMQQQVPQEPTAEMNPSSQEQYAPEMETDVPEPYATQGYACGGKVRKYDKGGEIVKKLKVRTLPEFLALLEDTNILPEGDNGSWDNVHTLNDIDWEKLLQNQEFLNILNSRNPALGHVLSRGYDWGVYQPLGDGRATITDIDKSNWEGITGRDWRASGSKDAAYLQAVEGLTDADIDALDAEALAKRMMATEAYKNTSKWLENADNALMYLNTLLNDPNTPEKAKEYARQFVTEDGKWKPGFKYNYPTVFDEVRGKNPGTYWHSVKEANRGNQVENYVWNDDRGGWDAVLTDVDPEWSLEDAYAWNDADNAHKVNYYRRPAAEVKEPTKKVKKPGQQKNPEEEVEPVYQKTWPRYVGLLGPAVGLGLQAAGLGKPDYSDLNAAVKIGSGPAVGADYKPIGDYLRYDPIDLFAAMNRADAAARATDRAIMNSSLPQSSKNAALLANGYNSQLAEGDFFKKAQEYNDNLRARTGEFNKDTNKYNATAYTNNSQFNAQAANQQRQFLANLSASAAREKLANERDWYSSIYGNIGQLFNNLTALGDERARHNMVAAMAARGDFENATPETPGWESFIRYKENKNKKG